MFYRNRNIAAILNTLRSHLRLVGDLQIFHGGCLSRVFYPALVILFRLAFRRFWRGRVGHTIILYVPPPDFFVKFVFLQQLHYCVPSSQYIRAAENTPYGKRHTSRAKAYSSLQSILNESLRSPPSCLYYVPVDHSKHALLCLNPVKLFLHFGHSAAANPYNYVAALVLHGTPGSDGGLNRREYKWLALSAKFNVKQHRWRENSYVFQVDQ